MLKASVADVIYVICEIHTDENTCEMYKNNFESVLIFKTYNIHSFTWCSVSFVSYDWKGKGQILK